MTLPIRILRLQPLGPIFLASSIFPPWAGYTLANYLSAGQRRILTQRNRATFTIYHSVVLPLKSPSLASASLFSFSYDSILMMRGRIDRTEGARYQSIEQPHSSNIFYFFYLSPMDKVHYVQVSYRYLHHGTPSQREA